jgi:hypothetical protein
MKSDKNINQKYLKQLKEKTVDDLLNEENSDDDDDEKDDFMKPLSGNKSLPPTSKPVPINP